MPDGRAAAIVPAAGLSLRMGRAKPLIDLGDGSMLHRVVLALRTGGVARVVVIAPPEDRPESGPIVAEATGAGAEAVVPPQQPIDMRESVGLGLEYLEARPAPARLLIAPADVPGINPLLVDRLIRSGREHRGAIVVPVAEGKKGHPLLLPWSVALSIRDLPAGVGVKGLFDRPGQAVVQIPVFDRASFDDLDTPDDLRRWAERGPA